MKVFEYQILRYQPNRISEEFLNLGIVLFDKEEQKFAFKIVDSVSGISQIFEGINTRTLLKQLNFIQKYLKKNEEMLNSKIHFQNFSDIEEITSSILPKDDSSLYFSDVRKSMNVHIDALLDYLSNKVISFASDDKDKTISNDKEVWSKLYKKYFDELHISKYLKPKSIKTEYSNLSFERTWKNGVLNFFETVNFDLEKSETIKNKVHRWAGQIDELATAKENMHLYLLSQMPHNNNKEKKFIEKFLTSKSSSKVIVEIVRPEQASDFATDLKGKIVVHDEEIGDVF